jgi:asparagine synthase (glutamine-hydrolysing)
VQRLNLYERYMETAIYDAPYRRTNDFILRYHLSRMQLTARLENCTVMAATYGVDYQWPLWDQRLVQQYLSTPSIEKVGPKGMGRYLHRRAIDGVVPKRVAWKPSKDMGYASLHQQMNDTRVIGIAQSAERLASPLHPALETLIDTEKFRQQIAQAKAGKVSMEFGFTFRRRTDALAWLDGWLKDETNAA